MGYNYSRVARAFPSDKALKNYLDKHPGADKSKHYVEGPQSGMARAEKERAKAKDKRDDAKLRKDLEEGKRPGGSIN